MEIAVSHFTLDRVEICDTTIGALLRRTRDSEITNSRFDRNNGHAIATRSFGPIGRQYVYRQRIYSNQFLIYSRGSHSPC